MNLAALADPTALQEIVARVHPEWFQPLPLAEGRGYACQSIGLGSVRFCVPVLPGHFDSPVWPLIITWWVERWTWSNGAWGYYKKEPIPVHVMLGADERRDHHVMVEMGHLLTILPPDGIAVYIGTPTPALSAVLCAQGVRIVQPKGIAS